MISEARVSELKNIVINLDEVLTETSAKADCRLSPEFKKAFFDDLREAGWHENLITLCEYIIDN